MTSDVTAINIGRVIANSDLCNLPQDMTFYGIDLGTSYTVITRISVKDLLCAEGWQIPVKFCTIKQSSPLPLDGSDNAELVASILAVGDDGKMYVGNKLYPLKANVRFVKDTNIFYHWKLDLGISKKPLYLQAVRNDVDDASKVAGKILNYCRKHIVGDISWQNVIVTVPASFQNQQRKDVLNAIQYANIDVHENMLFDEPTSAFLGYYNQIPPEERMKLISKDINRILVVDFGGGTTDLSTIALSRISDIEMAIDNVAISRYNDLGGQDIDMMIAENILLPQITQSIGHDFSESEISSLLLPQLAVMAEKMKIDICSTIGGQNIDSTDISVGANTFSVLEDQTVEVSGSKYTIDSVRLNAVELDDVMAYLFHTDEYEFKLTDKTIRSVPTVVANVMEKSNWKLTDLDYILLAGGSVKNPIFVQRLHKLIPNAVILFPQRPETIVSVGAAIKSFYKYGFGKELFHPICSDSIGVSLQNAPFLPLIKAGQRLPFEVELEEFSLQNDFQSSIEIPCNINDANTVLGIMKFDSGELTCHDKIAIKMSMDTNKTLKIFARSNGSLLGEMEFLPSQINYNMSEEERAVFNKEQEMEQARMRNNYVEEKRLLRSLIWEYYYLGNYKRSIQAGEQYIKDFDSTDAYVYNIIYCAYCELGQKKKAEEYLDRALALSPNNDNLVYNKSLCIESREDAKAALDFINTKPCNSKNLKFRKALLSAACGDKSLAQDIYDKFTSGNCYVSDSLESRLLKRVLNVIDRNNSYGVIEEPTSQIQTMTFNAKSLLKMRGSIVKD